MDRHLAGLALSGGGIRSATFALGVLQGLADLKILSRFDYLSTVSGGGYIGGWLAAWMKREGDPLSVERQLAPSRITQADTDRDVIGRGRIVDEEPEALKHLRAYSNYLTPRPGLLKVDTWTVLMIYVRNALINQLLLFPLVMIAVLLGRCVVWFYGISGHSDVLRSVVFWLFCALFILALLSMGLHVSRLLYQRATRPPGPEQARRKRWMGVTLAFTILVPLVVSAVLACWTFSIEPRVGAYRPGGLPLDERSFKIRLPGRELQGAGLGGGAGSAREEASEGWLTRALEQLQPNADESPFGICQQFLDVRASVFHPWYDEGAFLWISAFEYGIVFGLLALVLHVIGYGLGVVFGLDPDTLARTSGESRSRLLGFVWMSMAALIAGFNGGFFFFTIASQVLWRLHDQPYAVVTIGPPLALLVVVAAVFVEIWLLGRWQADDLREWWARLCAWLVIIATAWVAFFGVTVYGPMVVQSYVGPYVKSALAAGWLSLASAGAYAARLPSATPGSSGWVVKLLVRAAPPVFLAGLLIAISMAVNAVVFEATLVGLDTSAARIALESPSAPFVYWVHLVHTPIANILLALDVCLLLVTVASLMSNVNLFSLNSMYAQRLTRCYLGASRRKRQWWLRGQSWLPGSGGAPTATHGPLRWENSVTGFDPRDDIPLWRMCIGAEPGVDGAIRDDGREYFGPHLIINTALNLVSGAELAWQDRKAESFSLTPTYCGSKGTGYASTIPPTGRELTLGRAVSISGAAVDSNIGVHQSSALIALMTSLNARLGWWIKNPNQPDWDAGSPGLAFPLVWELLGRTDEHKRYVHLSDGGHFENLAVYELIRRRCRYIVCCDAGTDPGASDDNLANMLRLVRTDFGVRIDVSTSFLAQRGDAKLSLWHCAVGRIRYDDVDGGELPGIFVYLRTSMTGDEPPDVQEYAAKNPPFPWQSTLDQFFDEAQFESYRALGFHVAQSTFKDALDDLARAEPLWSNRGAEIEFKRGNQRLFSAVQRRWSPAPASDGSDVTPASRAWVDVQRSLRTDRDLASLSSEVYPELDRELADGLAGPVLHAAAEMIEVMETAWLELRQSGFKDIPMNRGWMGVFRRWAGTPTIRRLWPILRGEFSQSFVKFCETNLELGVRVGAAARAQLEAADKAFVEGARAILGTEFASEWPGEKTLEGLISEAEANWGAWTDQQPIELLIQAPMGEGEIALSPDKIPCGIVFLTHIGNADPVRKSLARFEIFIWMRRPYRGMGIASRCARKVLTEFRGMPRDAHRAQPYIIQARYPVRRADSMDPTTGEMEYLVWRNFFSHYDFRCPRGEAPVRDGYWVIERTFQPGDIEP
jgi:hypothetical protein